MGRWASSSHDGAEQTGRCMCVSYEEHAALAALVAGAIPGLSSVVKECTETMLPCDVSNDTIHTYIMPR